MTVLTVLATETVPAPPPQSLCSLLKTPYGSVIKKKHDSPCLSGFIFFFSVNVQNTEQNSAMPEPEAWWGKSPASSILWPALPEWAECVAVNILANDPVAFIVS